MSSLDYAAEKLSRILNQRLDPSPAQARAIASVLGCEVEDLIPPLNDERPTHPSAPRWFYPKVVG